MLKTKVNINMKPCMSHYTHKSIPDAKFEAVSSSSFGDMTSQNFPRKKRTTGFNFQRMSFLVSRIVLLNRKLTPMSISAIFKQRKVSSFSKFLGCFDDKRAATQQQLINFAKIWSERVLRIKTKVTKFGHHRIRGF